ncbi:MAG: exo-alpha-sialidase [Kiritimatiellae bacterium]|nr:exo-alpha-sialidase [Kiritimatiellia bacterium]
MQNMIVVRLPACVGIVLACLAVNADAAVAWPVLGVGKQVIYDSVFEPKIVGVPPSNSGPGYFYVSDEGVLRLVGAERYGGKTYSVTMDSHDLGLNWDTSIFSGESYYWFQKCPWADYRLYVGPPEGGQKDKTKGICRKREKDGSGKVVTSHCLVEGAVSYGHLHPILSRKRWIYVTHANTRLGGAVKTPCVCWSDDDGGTWKHVVIPEADIANPTMIDPPHKALRWRVGHQEADIVECRDGSLLMIARASTDHHVWFVSKDGGETWSKPFERPEFWNHNTQPMFLRLHDGRILLIWNNTQILPKCDYAANPELMPFEIDGTWETVFTNRDALHAAISEDDGKTWIGFREIALNDIRNREDYREVGNEFWSREIDKSVHQADAVELPGGKIAVVYGQNKACRRIALFDLKWLYEKSREEDLRLGTVNISNHLYLKSLLGSMRGWSGHCAMNRVPGAAMVREPDTIKGTERECLQICRIHDERLVDERQGVVWNFPAARRGSVEFECRIDGCGVRVSLCDHWINPCAPNVRENSPFSAPLAAKSLDGEGKWTKVKFRWNLDAKTVTVVCEGREKVLPLRTEGFSPFGISYLHLQTMAEGHDPKGTYFRWFKMKAEE